MGPVAGLHGLRWDDCSVYEKVATWMMELAVVVICDEVLPEASACLRLVLCWLPTMTS